MCEAAVKNNLEMAITIMRNGCDRAARQAARGKATPEERIAAVQSILAWSLANASSSIHSALAECSDARRVRGELV